MDTTRQAILDATLELVGERGFSALTSRAIADKAGVALGLVNYHFGGKDAAVAEAYRFVTVELRDAFGALDGDAPPEVRLRRFATGFAFVVRRHGSALAFFAGRGVGRIDAPTDYRYFALGEGLGKAHEAMRALDPSVGRELAAMRLSAFAGALLYPELVPGALGLDMDTPGQRDAYVSMLADLLVGDRGMAPGASRRRGRKKGGIDDSES